MKTILRETLPCWYELSWNPKKVAIILRIHRDFIRDKKVIPENAPIVQYFKQEFGFQHFGRDPACDFGFDQAFKLKNSFGEFVEFEISIPKIRIKTDKHCGSCRGTGKDQFRQGKCLLCEGTGKEYYYDWKKARMISASFNIFFVFAFMHQGETSAKTPQLMEIQVTTDRGMHGGSLCGVYGIKTCDFLRSLGPRYQISEMVEAMVASNRRMFGKVSRYEESYFWAIVEGSKGWLNVSCPGNACGLHPGVNCQMELGRGYEFSCHNVDSPMQQLTLLSALAVLHDLVRRSEK